MVILRCLFSTRYSLYFFLYCDNIILEDSVDMKNKKGFTLIELMAVLLIIALIAVLIVPKVRVLLHDSKRSIYFEDATRIVKAFEEYYITETTRGTFSPCTYVFYEDGENTCDGLVLDGEKPSGGLLTINKNGDIDGTVGYNNYDFTYYHGELVKSGTDLGGAVYDFNYVDGASKEQHMDIVLMGFYKLEVWGASGNSVSYSNNYGNYTSQPGYGGYASGIFWFNSGAELYINVGGQGVANPTTSDSTVTGGYNGGGSHSADFWGPGSSGGGATHIALVPGTLASFDANNDKIASASEIEYLLLVAGGGGSGGVEITYRYTDGGHGGGYLGTDSKLYADTTPGPGPGGTQNSGNAIGNGSGGGGWSGAAGGGFYGGRVNAGGGGGSGYIGNSRTIDGEMYCYNCAESSEPSIKTISTTGSSEFKNSTGCPEGFSAGPISRCAKYGNGYARITYLGITL